MPEIRQNIATREWVIIATDRARRPEEFVQASKERIEDRPAHAPHCPFCPGNEELDLERLRVPIHGDWLLRVVQNRYPALNPASDRIQLSNGFHGTVAGFGHHEVIVESRLHNTCPALEPVEDVERTLRAFQARGAQLRIDGRIEQMVYFKNHGLTAGASLLHPHTQLIALPVVPYSVQKRVDEAQRYFDTHGECVFCRMRAEEEQQESRIVLQSEFFTVFTPYAAYSPFHLWIIPRRHTADFLDATPTELRDLSVLLRTVLRKIYFGLNDPDYNYVIRSAPEGARAAPHLHWYISIVPRVMRSAGFEMGSGMFINTALPEESARFLREITPP